jgi:NAD(P)H-quinone oxidoreductase subunit 6
MAISELLINVVFYGVAAAALGGGIAVALSKNIVRSAFALLTVLFSVAGIYALVRADFIVAAQVLIFVGGILVLIIFAIMLTHKITDVKLSNESSPGPVSITACACLFLLIVVALVVGYDWRRSPKILRIADFGNAPADLSQWQGGGQTWIAPGPGAKVLDGFVRVQVTTRSDPGNSRAQFRLSRLQKDGSWKDLEPTKPVKFAQEKEGFVAWHEFERLEEAKYRWSVRLDRPDVESAWVDYGLEQGKPDFESEKGLTRAIGRAFMGNYLLAFEVVSVLLLAALVGASFLARKEVRS